MSKNGGNATSAATALYWVEGSHYALDDDDTRYASIVSGGLHSHRKTRTGMHNALRRYCTTVSHAIDFVRLTESDGRSRTAATYEHTIWERHDL